MRLRRIGVSVCGLVLALGAVRGGLAEPAEEKSPFAAADAQIFSGPGEFITGPGAITDSFGPPDKKSSLVWHPVEGEIAKTVEPLGLSSAQRSTTAVSPSRRSPRCRSYQR